MLGPFAVAQEMGWLYKNRVDANSLDAKKLNCQIWTALNRAHTMFTPGQKLKLGIIPEGGWHQQGHAVQTNSWPGGTFLQYFHG